MTDSRSEAERLREQGLDVETVAEIIDEMDQERSRATGNETPVQEPLVAVTGARTFDLPVREGYEPVSPLAPGIYFGLPESVYHAVPALSTSGIKRIAASPMIFWATCPWLNPDWAELKKEEEERRKRLGQDHFDIGKAYHARLLEGREAFDERFAVALDKSDYPDALVTHADIKAKLAEYDIDKCPAAKPAAFEKLVALDPDAKLWERIVAEHEAANPGKCFIPFKARRELEKAAAIIERDPELGPLIAGGYAEVSLFWNCQQTGVPMKCRADKLKVETVIDLKTVQNSHEASIENAIRRDIANRRYVIQPAVYLEGVAAVRKLVREHGASVIYSCEKPADYAPDPLPDHHERVQWAKDWAAYKGETDWHWLYQQKGIAPVARALTFPTHGSLMMFARDIVEAMKKRLIQYGEVFGTDPYLDIAPIYDLDDTDLPNYATEI